jgi:hypothetical protein
VLSYRCETLKKVSVLNIKLVLYLELTGKSKIEILQIYSTTILDNPVETKDFKLNVVKIK